jgi:transposase-like protein
MAAAAFRTVFADATQEEISLLWGHAAVASSHNSPTLMEGVKEEVLSFGASPRARWRQPCSTNLLEWLNPELK